MNKYLKEEIEELYFKNNLSVNRISEILGYSTSTIYNYLKEIRKVDKKTPQKNEEIKAFRVSVTDNNGEVVEIFTTWKSCQEFPGIGFYANVKQIMEDNDCGDIKVEAMYNEKWERLW